MGGARATLLAAMAAVLTACSGGGGAAAPPVACVDGDGACGSGGCTPFDDLECVDVARIQADVAYLASPALTGRGSASAGNELAVEHLAERMRALGLSAAGDPAGASRSFRQRFPYSTWEITEVPIVTLGGAALAYPGDLAPMRFSGSADVAGEEIAFVGYGLSVGDYDPAAFPGCTLPRGHDDYAGVDVRGKLVVAVRGPPFAACPSASLTAQWELARARGAAALVVTRNFATGDGPPPYAAGLLPTSDADASGVPIVFATRAAIAQRLPQLREWVAAVDATRSPAPRVVASPWRVRVQGQRREAALENVLGAVPGADPALSREVVVVGAHLDHDGTVPFSSIWFPGADDNASGTAVMLELARALAAGPPPRRTVVFAGWNGEERGLLGSRHYVVGTRDPVLGRDVLPDLAYPIAETVAAFSVDMVGAGDGTGLLLYNGAQPLAASLATLVHDAAAARGMAAATTPREVSDRSDHVYFDRAGIPALLALSRGDERTFHLHYHTPQDTPATLDPRDLATSARVLWAALQELAHGGADPRPTAMSRASLSRALAAKRVPPRDDHPELSR